MELRVTKQDHEALKRSTHKDKSNQSRGDVRFAARPQPATAPAPRTRTRANGHAKGALCAVHIATSTDFCVCCERRLNRALEELDK